MRRAPPGSRPPILHRPDAPKSHRRHPRPMPSGNSATGAGTGNNMSGYQGTMPSARRRPPTGSPIIGSRGPAAGCGSKDSGPRNQGPDCLLRGTPGPVGPGARSALDQCGQANDAARLSAARASRKARPQPRTGPVQLLGLGGTVETSIVIITVIPRKLLPRGDGNPV